MKKNCWLLLLLVCGSVSAQVGVNTTLPLKPFHVDGKKDNPPSGALNSEQESNDVVVDKDGNVGIGTTSPKVKLDVRGDMAIEKKFTVTDIKYMDINDVAPLYIDKNGVIGKTKKVSIRPISFLSSTDTRNSGKSFNDNFNAGVKVVFPLQSKDIDFSLGDATEVVGDYLKIKQDGSYSLALLLNLAIRGSSSDYKLYIYGDISYSRDGGTSWNSIVSVRPIQDANNVETSYQVIFPTVIAQLKTNDLLRITYTRSKSGGSFEGNGISTILAKQDTELKMKTYQFSIIKQ